MLLFQALSHELFFPNISMIPNVTLILYNSSGTLILSDILDTILTIFHQQNSQSETIGFSQQHTVVFC